VLTFWKRWAPALGVATGVLWTAAFFFGGSTPDTTGTQAQVVSYYSSGGNQHRQMLALVIFVIGIACLLGFLVTLRERLSAALGDSGVPTLALVAGVVSASLWLVAVCCMVAPAFMADDTGGATLSLTAYRVFNDLGFACWMMAGMLSSVVIWSTAAVALRTSILPRWFAWVSIVAGVLVLASFMFIPALLYWVWLIAASALLQWRKAPLTVPAGAAATTA
jgi:hypothetical protein